MKNLFLITSSFPFYPGEQFLEAEIKILAQHFEFVYLIPFVCDKSTPPRSLPSNVVVLEEVCSFRARNKYNLLSRLAGIRRCLDAIKNEIQKRKGLFFSHPILIIKLLRMASVSGQAVPTLKSLMIKYHPNVVYSYWLSIGSLTSCLAIENLKKNIPIISRCHGFDLYKERHKPAHCLFQLFLISKVDAVLPVSEQGRKYLAKKYPSINQEKLKTFQLGVFSGVAAKKSEDGVFRIVSCSYMIPVKRLHLIIEALKYIDFPVLWTHIGDGPLRRELQEKGEKLSSVNKNITFDFLGQKPNKDVLVFYESNPVDLFINVSESEGIPVSIMEAASRSIPVIATDVGGTSEIVDESKGAGYLLPALVSPEEIAVKIKNYFELPGEMKEKMRTSIFNIWKARFDAEKNYKEFCRFLTNIGNNFHDEW